ncbi:MAG: hypothetical protein ACM3NO_08965 [Deltaproteobacteria bacterium]
MQRNRNFQPVGIDQAPGCRNKADLGVFERHRFDAAGHVGFDVDGIAPPHDHSVGVVGPDFPLGWMSVAEMEGGPFKFVETPETDDLSGDVVVEIMSLKGMRINRQAAARSVGDNGQVNAFSGLAIHVKD